MTKDHDKIIEHDVEIQALNKKVDLILENHLPHIQISLNKINDRLALWSGAIIIIGLLAPYALNILTN